MNLKTKHVAVIGGGISGLTAADEMARLGVNVTVIEKSPFLGGHAIQYSCKATDTCVKCGACMVEEKLQQASHHPNVTFYTGTAVVQVSTDSDGRYNLDYETRSPFVDEDKCDGCGICFQKCPVSGALVQGKTPHMGPFVAIRSDLCLFFGKTSCTLCRDTCPQGAIRLSKEQQSGAMKVDAILVATGFSPFDPSSKSYGYGQFKDVITNLDADRILHQHGSMMRPSDGQVPGRIAFIQCVGSRDTTLGHAWCSKICCGAALRMARLIQWKQPETEVTFFYIDVQTFGKNFQTFYDKTRSSVQMIRSIPGDIFKTAEDRLKVIYFDPQTQKPEETLFDMVVLSVGMVPSSDNHVITKLFNWSATDSGFLKPDLMVKDDLQKGVFISGAAQGPMSIAESINNAGQTVWEMVNYLEANSC